MSPENPDSKHFIDSPDAAERITSVLTEWLAAEVQTSSTDHNAVLDDFEAFHTGMLNGIDDPKAYNAGKNLSHHNRMIRGIEQIDQRPRDEWSALMLFYVQMYLSGSFRNQVQVQGTSKEDYLARRGMPNALGIDLDAVVHERLAAPVLTLEELIDTSKETNDAMQESVIFMYGRGAEDLGQEESPTVYVMKEMQVAWAELAVDYIKYAADQHGGDLSQVAFRPPVSITRHSDHPEIYPFRD